MLSHSHQRRSPLVLFLILLFASCLVWSPVLRGPSTAQTENANSPLATANFIDNVGFFVRQHYLDFLSREPDPDGLQFWTNQITSCGTNAQCLEVRQINVSASFFLSIEFQETGYLVYRFYKAAYGNIPGKPVPITRRELVLDGQAIGQGVRVGIGNWQQQLEQNKKTYASDFVITSRFAALYPAGLSAASFVGTLDQNAGGPLSQSERDALVAALAAGTVTRAQVLRSVAESQKLKDAEFRKAFVLLEYFGYLGRNPDEAPDTDFSGFNFWLNKLNNFNGDYIKAEMVKAFLSSIEYRSRFAQPTLSAFGNPADPLLLRAVTSRGEVVEYFGKKDSLGQASALTSVRVTKDSKTTNITLDDKGRPSQIQAFDGTFFKITWQSNTSIVVTALSSDGSVQVNIPIDLAAQAVAWRDSSRTHDLAARSGNETETPLINRSPRGGKPVELNVRPVDHLENSPPLTPAGTSVVNVVRCGNPVNDASVAMTVIPSSAPSSAYTTPGTLGSPGQYSVSIPTAASPGQKAQDVCGNIAGALGTGCDGLSTIPPGMEAVLCAQIGVAVSTVGTPAAGGAVFAACEVSFVGARLYCDTLGWSPTVGAPSLLELLCGNIGSIVDRFAGGEVRLIPIVFVPGRGILDTSGLTAPSSGPFPNFTVEAGKGVEIVSFTTSPADPAPFQSYVAVAQIQCAPPGTKVTISIRGTDGYADSKTVTIQGDASVSLNVPGAEANVQDVVTVAISGGPTRAVALVF